MLLKDLFQKEHIQRIADLTKAQGIKEIRASLLRLNRSDLKPIQSKEHTCAFMESWNQFVSGTNSEADLELITNCFYNDQIFRSTGFLKKENEFRITTKWFNTEPISHLCKKTQWHLRFELTKNYDLDFWTKCLVIDEANLPPFELAKFYSIANIRKIRDLYAATKSVTQADRDVFISKKIELVKEMFSKLDVSKLKPIDPMGYEVSFFTAWNNLIKKVKLSSHEWYLIGMAFGSDLYMKELGIKDGVLTVSDHLSFSSGDYKCQKTGTSFMFGFNTEMGFELSQWEPTTITVDGEEIYTGNYVPMRPIAFKDKICEKILTFKTGNLLINDWFRCDNNEFNDIVKEKNYNSINYAAGRVKEIARYADEFNFASVNIGNSCPYIFKSHNKLFIGRGPESKKIGSVCTDLWNATIIEEEHLLELLIKNGMTKVKAKAQITKLKKIWTCNQVKVKPGTYKLSFMGDYEKFSSAYKKKNKVPAGVSPYFALERIGD